MLTNAIHIVKSASERNCIEWFWQGSKGRYSLKKISGIKMSFVYSIYAHDFSLLRQIISVVCYPTCRWGWPSWCDFCSGWPCWEVAGPWYRPKIAPRWPGYHPLSQCPLSWWLLEKSALIVAETELQCMYQSRILCSEFLFCPCHKCTCFPWLQLNFICPCMLNQSVTFTL